MAALEQFGRNRDALTTQYTATETALDNVENLLIRAQELAVQAANDTLNPQDRQIVEQEIAQLFAEAMQSGNTESNGSHIFAGRRTDKPPFTTLSGVENLGSGLAPSGSLTTFGVGDLVLNGTALRVPVAGDDTVSTSDNTASAMALAAVVNEATVVTDVRAQARTILNLTATNFGNLGVGELVINGQAVTGTITDAASFVTAVNATNIPGVTAFSTAPDQMGLVAADGRNIRLQTSGGTTGMNFAEFDLSGGALDQTVRGTVALFADSPLTIAGADPTQAGFRPGLVTGVVGARYTGDAGRIDLALSASQELRANIVGSQFLVADIRPNIEANTTLASLRDGLGISPGTLVVTDRAGGSATIDVSTAVTVNDVLTAISSAPGINVTASVNTAGNGITIVDNNATPIQNLTIQDAVGGTTASELGLVADRPGDIVGTPLEPRLTPATPLSLLYDGQGVQLGTIHIANGDTEADVDLSTALTVGDVLDTINRSGTNVIAHISMTGTAIDISSVAPATVAVVTDVGKSAAVSDLGIQGAHDVLKTLRLLQQALEVNDGRAISRLITHMEIGLEQVRNLRGEIGARMNRVDFVEENHSQLELAVTSMLSEIEDVDAVDAFTRLTQLSNVFQAALAATAQTARLSLLNFLQ
jgi:flagellin-like hook-associated protein FlgL